MKISAPSFQGNWILHPTKQNCKFISMDNNPNERDIQEAINATETEKAHSGLNGRAYFLGEDLVVKKYMTRQEASNYQPDAEIDALELMLKKGYRHPNIQQGKYAFKTSNNEIFSCIIKNTRAKT